MENLENLKRQIATAEDLHSVVRTMKTLAAVSIRQYEAAVASLQDYDRTIGLGFRVILAKDPGLGWFREHVDTLQRGAIVFGSDVGMCGQFNEQITNYVQEYAQQQEAGRGNLDRWSFVAVGRRAEARLEDAGLPVEKAFEMPGSVSGITLTVQEMLPEIEAWIQRRQLGSVTLFFSRRLAASNSEAVHFPLLPVANAIRKRWSAEPWPTRMLPLVTMPRDQLYSSLIRQYLFVQLFRACAESLSSENASRIVSMQAAERNISERLTELRGHYNNTRQTAITEELLDVATGFEALTRHKSLFQHALMRGCDLER